MKIRLHKGPLKTSIEIDPVPGNKFFSPFISISTFEVGEEKGTTEAKIISTYSGHLSAKEAGEYGKGLTCASFICRLVNNRQNLADYFQLESWSSGTSLEAVFNALKNHNPDFIGEFWENKNNVAPRKETKKPMATRNWNFTRRQL